jgi:hypothetical protein
MKEMRQCLAAQIGECGYDKYSQLHQCFSRKITSRLTPEKRFKFGEDMSGNHNRQRNLGLALPLAMLRAFDLSGDSRTS